MRVEVRGIKSDHFQHVFDRTSAITGSGQVNSEIEMTPRKIGCLGHHISVERH